MPPKFGFEELAKKRKNCFYYRYDTKVAEFPNEVCEKKGFKRPCLMECMECEFYTPFVSVREFSEREKLKQDIENIRRKNIMKNEGVNAAKKQASLLNFMDEFEIMIEEIKL